MAAHRSRALALVAALSAALVLAVVLCTRDGRSDAPERFLFFAPSAPSTPPPPPPPYVALRDAAPARPLIGTAYNDFRLWGLGDAAAEAQYEALLAANFNVLTAENACKPAAIMPTRDAPPDFAPCDRVLAFAREHGMRFRLHVIGWGEWNPEWMVQLPSEEREDALLDYARAVLLHYNGSVDYVDVVNEAVCDQIAFTASKRNCGSGPGELKAGQWVPSVPSYLDRLFLLARELCAECILVYNEYGHESNADPIDGGKHERVLSTVRAALSRGVPIDAVGFQFHASNLATGHGVLGLPFAGYLPGVRHAFAHFAALGVALHVTEIDVGCTVPTMPCTPWESDGARQEAQAAVYSAALAACVENPACTVFQTWGPTDRFSWRDGGWEATAATSLAPSRLMDQRAHLFTRDYEPKAAYWALLKVLQDAAASPA
ncbi:hypothetical protein KFE25_005923 [Diacronema lutheri]|uniref:endo-1,4-beta-xylanase n=2 Tax=Diacronema lutheri TaxID=2081491 RepID=A0A8J5XQ13_DIALT|nr:hypothetical protein KFE25_005923 [Diacronema lutheri]